MQCWSQNAANSTINLKKKKEKRTSTTDRDDHRRRNKQYTQAFNDDFVDFKEIKTSKTKNWWRQSWLIEMKKEWKEEEKKIVFMGHCISICPNDLRMISKFIILWIQSNVLGCEPASLLWLSKIIQKHGNLFAKCWLNADFCFFLFSINYARQSISWELH